MENNLKIIEIFFRLIQDNKKVEYFIHRILCKQGTAVNIIFSHLLLDHKIIEKKKVNEIIETEIERQQIIKKILKKLSNSLYLSSTYLIKICLFLEVEEYLNENQSKNEPIFRTLKNIAYYIRSKKNLQEFYLSESSLLNKQKNVNLTKVFQELANYHLEDLGNLKENNLRFILKIAFLFTGLENDTCDVGDYQFYVDKFSIITGLRLDRIEIEINNKMIAENISKHYNESMRKESIVNLELAIIHFKKIKRAKSSNETIFYKNKIKRILKKINPQVCKKIIKVALYKEIDNIYDYEIRIKFENELKNEGIKEIEYIFTSDQSMKQVANKIYEIDPNIINEYMTEEKNNFFKKLMINIDENVRRYCKKNLLKHSKALFECGFMYSEAIKKENENKMVKIKTILSDTEIIEILNEEIGINLIDELIKTLKKVEE
ncbi:uncharacterized protein VNE69_03377 [Vairimorpha necatrix]|uniref:Uncharacterized protein n=1 Tax=Vairimorpha necatrix TaxID=6039 RepID=A0AAX4JB30_9MICR